MADKKSVFEKDGRKKKGQKEKGDNAAAGKWSGGGKHWPRDILHPEATLTVPRLTNAKEARKFLKWLQPEEKQLLAEALTNSAASAPAESAEEGEVPASGVEQPSSSALYHLALHQSLPFVGFGFLDNLIMIVAGEYIDHTIGVSLGISTMAAAALGNAVSDVFGVGSAWYVERFCAKLGIPGPPPLTLEQLDLPRARVAANAGRAVGVAVGCVVGMLPLLFQ